MINQQQIAQDWQQRGFSCDLWTDPPGQVWEDFVHAVDELVILVDGRIELEMDGKTFCPKAGEEVFIPGRVMHSVRNIGGTTANWLYGYRQS